MPGQNIRGRRRRRRRRGARRGPAQAQGRRKGERRRAWDAGASVARQGTSIGRLGGDGSCRGAFGAAGMAQRGQRNGEHASDEGDGDRLVLHDHHVICRGCGCVGAVSAIGLRGRVLLQWNCHGDAVVVTAVCGRTKRREM